MSENKKPEWIELADAEGRPELRKVSRSIPTSAVLVTTLILGVGAVMGQTNNETPASAVSANAVTATDSQASPVSTAVAAVKSTVSNPATAAVVGAAHKLTNPSIAKLPTGGGEDDEDDDYKGRDHHEDYDDEGNDD